MHTNNVLQWRNMQMSLTVDTDVYDSVSPSVDSLSTKLKHNVAKQKGQ